VLSTTELRKKAVSDQANPRAAKKPRSQRLNVGPASGAKAISAEQRSQRAVQLRLRGYSLADVAQELGYADPSGAFRAVMRGLKADLPDARRDELRALEVARLDALMAAHWQAATDGRNEKSSAIVLRCVAQRARLLGLDAPQHVDLSVREGEVMRVEILDMLNDETLEALKPFQEEMVRLSELRAGVTVAAR
jgi:hypothetical protein